jgi:hypothetical protein
MPEEQLGREVLSFLVKYFALPVAAFIVATAIAERKARNVGH